VVLSFFFGGGRRVATLQLKNMKNFLIPRLLRRQPKGDIFLGLFVEVNLLL
jgi:hypothetical protein